jgi:acetyl-CoA carboxylase biotin carboxyl carrier protein
MDFKNIKKFIDIAKDEGVAELKYETKEVKISVNFLGKGQQVVAQPTTTIQPVANVQASDSATVTSSNDGFHEITSPFVGTFYSSPSPNDPAFVKVGDKVSKGQTLCILEAMKIMNEIESDVAGEIVEICMDNESLCEFGQTLFKIRV